MELDRSGFMTQGATVYAGNVGDNEYIIQVTKHGIKLIQGGQSLVTQWSVLCHLPNSYREVSQWSLSGYFNVLH